MTRKKMIDMAIMYVEIGTNDKNTRNNFFEDMLLDGFKGFNNFTDQELKLFLEKIDDKEFFQLLDMGSDLIEETRKDYQSNKQI